MTPTGYGARSRQEARALFRRSHNVGQKVRGLLLGWERAGLARVRIEGCELLAAVTGEVEPGRVLRFRIEQLLPEIVLRELTAAATPLPDAPLALAHAFLAARPLLESSLAPLLHGLEQLPATGRRAAFFQALAASPALLPAWTELLARLGRINNHLAAQGAAFWYAPWLAPLGRDMEGLRLSGAPGQGDALVEIACALTLEPLGRCEIRILEKGRDTSWRVLVEHPAHAALVRQAIVAAFGPWPHLAGIAPSVAQLPPGRGSLLTALWERRGPAGPSLLNTRV